MYLRNLQNLVRGALIEAEIVTSPLLHVFAQLGPVFGNQHSAYGCVSTSQVVLKCSYVSQEPPKFGEWGPNRSCNIDLCPIPCIYSSWPSDWVLAVCPSVCKHLPSVLKCSYVSQEPPKNLVHASTMRSELNSISEVPTPDPPGIYVLAPDPLGIRRYPCTACFKILHMHISHLENSMLAF